MKRIWVPQPVVILMDAWAFYPGNPYACYVPPRWICCPAFAYLAVQAYRRGLTDWVWILGLLRPSTILSLRCR